MIAEARLRGGRPAPGVRPPARSSRPSAPPAHAGPRHDHAARRLGVRHQEGDRHLLEEGVEFSLSVTRNKRITAAIEAIDEAAYTPVHYPGAVDDPDTGTLISDAEVAETPYPLRLGPAAPSPCG